MKTSKPSIKDYRYIALDMTSQTVGVTLAKVTISVIPVFIYLMFRQIAMSIYLIIHDKKVLSRLKSEYVASTKSIKIQTIMFGVLRSLNIVIAYYAFDKMDLSLFTSLESPITVMFSVLLGILILKERPTFKFYFSIAVILLGVTLITGFNATGMTPVILVLLMFNGFALAMGSILTQNISATLSSPSITFVGIVGALPAVAIAALIQVIYQHLDWLSELNWFIIMTAILGTVCTLIANIMAIKAQLAIGATRFQVIKTFSVVLALAPATLLLKETITSVQALGIVLSVVGVIMVILARTRVKEI